MLKAYQSPIEQLILLTAHAGVKPVNGQRVYAVAAAVLSPGNPRRDFSLAIQYPWFTARDQCLSVLSAPELSVAPAYPEACQRLQEFLQTAAAPNASRFALTLDPAGVSDELIRMSKISRLLDLNFCAEFFQPNLESVSFRSLWEMITGTRREKIGFTIQEALDLAVQVIGWIAGNRLNDQLNPAAPVLRHFLEHSDTLFGKALTHIACCFSQYFSADISPCTLPDTPYWESLLETNAGGRPRKEAREPVVQVSDNNLETVFQEMVDELTVYRSEQVTYSKHVAAALNDAANLIIEAGTGTGKTRGYLIPAFEFLSRNKRLKMAVSTYTKNLQDQLFQWEIPHILQRIPAYQNIRVAVLKGKSSHVCVEKLKSMFDQRLTGQALIVWLYFLNAVFQFRAVEADSFGERTREYLEHGYLASFFAEVTAGTGCKPNHVHCPAQVMAAEAAAADLVITNHHKLALLDQDPLLADLFDYYIIDEANHFEHAIRNTFGVKVNSWELSGLLSAMTPLISRLLSRSAGDLEGELTSIIAHAETIRLAIRDIGMLLKDFARGTADNNTALELHSDHPIMKNGGLANLIETLMDGLKTMVKNFEAILKPHAARMLKIRSDTAQRFRSAMDALENSAQALRSIMACLDRDDQAASSQSWERHWILSAHHVEVSELIETWITKKKQGIIYTAATLRHCGDFQDFCRIVGLPPEIINAPTRPENSPLCRAVAIPSPFAKNAAEIIVPREAVSGKFDNKELWLKSVADLLPRLIEENQGRTLALFGSYADLAAVAERLAEVIANSPYPILIQQKGQSTIPLYNEFRTITESVLFGVDSFWYGVDFRGETLTQVIITRIPYPALGDPILKARRRNLPQDQYWRRYMYETAIKLKQGMGRLIRCDTDRGKIVILDSRFRQLRFPL